MPDTTTTIINKDQEPKVVEPIKMEPKVQEILKVEPKVQEPELPMGNSPTTLVLILDKVRGYTTRQITIGNDTITVPPEQDMLVVDKLPVKVMIANCDINGHINNFAEYEFTQVNDTVPGIRTL